jgi:hypothetical protein
MKNVDMYRDLYLNEKDILPDTIAKEIEGAQTAEKTDGLVSLKSIQNEIITHRVISIYFMIRNLTTIHKILKKNNYLQAVSFGNYIFEAKGILVMLKIISEKLLSTEVQLELNTFDLDAPPSVIKESGPVEGVVQDILYLFFYIAYDYPEIVVNFLNEYKAQYAIKKYPKLYPQNEQIKRLTYLLLKKQMDLLPKKIKANPANMAIVSHNYSAYVEKSQKDSSMSSSRSMSISVNISSHSSFSSFSKTNNLQHMNATLMKGCLADLISD